MSGHGHAHGAGACEHEHKETDEDGVEERWLLDCIDVGSIRGLNADPEHPARNAFKSHSDRSSVDNFVLSDADEQLIIFIPFTGMVRLTSIVVSGGPGEDAPSRMKVFTNREDVDFDNADAIPAVQDFELAPQQPPELEYKFRMAKFGNVQNLTLYFPENFGGDITRINYIGIKGVFRHLKVEAVTAVYEARAQAADHKTKATFEQPRSIQ